MNDKNKVKITNALPFPATSYNLLTNCSLILLGLAAPVLLLGRPPCPIDKHNENESVK